MTGPRAKLLTSATGASGALPGSCRGGCVVNAVARSEEWESVNFWCSHCKGEHPLGKCPLEGKCQFCKTREATSHWGDAMSFIHGGSLDVCDLCVAEKQLEHARERAALIPELEKRVAGLRTADAEAAVSKEVSRG